MSDAPPPPPIVLASRSPRRRDLLGLLVGAGRVRVLPPDDPGEEDLTGLHDWRSVEGGLLRVAAKKCADVRGRLADEYLTSDREPRAGRFAAVVAADTAVIAGEEDGRLTVLGQPPERDWEPVVRRWYRTHLIGRTHTVATAVCVAAAAKAAGGGEPTDPAGPAERRLLVRTRVTFRADAERHLDRLFAADDPVGKAGGYAVQGLAGMLVVERVDGSLSNVIGLPLRELSDLFVELGVRA